jgi:hypothetical protein
VITEKYHAKKTKYTETGFIILVIYAGSYKALLAMEN